MPELFLDNQLWFHGPSWLLIPEDHRPVSKFKPSLEKIPEKRKILCLLTINSSSEIDFNILERFSCYRTLRRVVAYCLRFLTKHKGPILPEELTHAETIILRITQNRHFADEMRYLKSNKPIKSNSKILNLNPFLGEDKLLRVGGRLQNSILSYASKHPIILPRSSHITNLIIQYFHYRYYHTGNQTTLHLLRQKFWPIDGLNQIRKNIKKCQTCFRAKPIMLDYKMGNLPDSRVILNRPFYDTGIDYCGPFYIKEKKYRNRNHLKIYVSIFVCMATKAVHIEVVSDLTTETFLAALRRFLARRGKPARIFSDNGTNFIGANNELKELYTLFQSDDHIENVTSYCTEQNIKFKFIPPSAPFFGGLWEAAVKSFKHHFKRVSHNNVFTFEEFTTLAIEIESILNSRPILPLSVDPQDLTALTPGHFLIGTALTTIPELNLQSTPTNRLSTWQHITKVRQDFWVRWKKEYLNQLQIRKKWNSSTDNVKEGMLVIIQEDNQPSMLWELGRIKELHPGRDGVVRTVTLQTHRGLMKRPVRKLAPLPIEDNE